MTRPVCNCSHRSTHLFWTSIVLAILWGVYRGAKTEILVMTELAQWDGELAQRTQQVDDLMERLNILAEELRQLQTATDQTVESVRTMEHAMVHWYDKLDRAMRQQATSR